MKASPQSQRARAGYTLTEMMVSTSIFGGVGLVLFSFLWSGSILLAKNTSINLAHQQARLAVVRMEDDIHAAVSVPALVDSSRNTVAAPGPAAGIAFQSWAAGPYQVYAGDYKTTQNTIDLIANGTVPQVNQRLNITTHAIENYITAVTSSGGKYHLTLDSNLANEVNTTLNGTAVDICGFITDQTAYVVQSNQLRRYSRKGGATYTILVTDVTAATPFSTPLSVTGAPYNRFVAAVNLSCADVTSTSQKFRAANMYLNSMVPYRSKLCQTQ